MLSKEQIIEGIAHLNQEARDAVLDALIRSRDELETVDDGQTVSDEEWTAEIDRRLERYERGESVTRSWEEVDAELERRIQRIERQATSPQ